MRWVTWEQVGIDRMACAWLIRRFVDPAAEFQFVPVGRQDMPAGAEPFDIPGARFSHHVQAQWILRSLAVALGLVGIRILVLAFA